MTFDAIIPFLLIMLAPAIGSFLAVLVDRLPRGEDVVRARSGCRECATPIAPWDLIPIASYIALRGRCRICAAPIPAFHLYVELLALG
ncbi:MAG: prepilin peptidase, partial [Pseudomonadota bacterium]